MAPYKFLLILRSLNEEDLKILGKFLRSPVFNSNKNLLSLYCHIRHSCPAFDEAGIDLPAIHKKLFRGRKFNQKIIRNLLYEFASVLEDFLALLGFLKDPLAANTFLLEELRHRSLDKLVPQNLKKGDTILSGIKVRDEKYYAGKLFLEQARFDHELINVPMGKSLVLSNIKAEYIKNVSAYFMLLMLSESFYKNSRKNLINSDIETKLAEYALGFLETEIDSYKDEIPLYLFYRYIKLEQIAGFDEFTLLKEQTITSRNYLSSKHFNDFMLELYNFCTLKEMEGKEDFAAEAFRLVKYMVENDLLLESDGSMLEHNYTNTVATALRRRETLWASGFIKKYHGLITEKKRENAYNYNTAAVDYIEAFSGTANKQKCLDRALDCLAKVKTEDFYHTTRINNLKLLIYYEFEDLEPCYSLIDTYGHFLRQNKLIPEPLKKRYLNFVNFANRLLNVRAGVKKSSLQKLEYDVSNGETEYRKWLLNKIQSLAEKKKTKLSNPAQ